MMNDLYIEELKELIAIPSISALREHKEDIRKCAEKLCELLTLKGFAAKLLETRGNPIVFGEYKVNRNAKTVLVYNHYDVQPATKEEWNSDPFKSIIADDENGNKVIIGRGSTDDKGPLLAILHAASDLSKNNELAVNVQVLYEGEEETGSEHFKETLEIHKKKLGINPDIVLVSDTIWFEDNPSISYGLRGLLYAFLRYTSGTKDGHSGMVGGSVVNPLKVLTKAVSSCYDEHTGKVLIPQFYDDILPFSKQEFQELEKSATLFNLEKFKLDTGFTKFTTNNKKEFLMRRFFEPTFEIHGYLGGYSGIGAKTVVPKTAEAKVSMRLVPGQIPEQIQKNFTEFIKRIDKNIEIEFSSCKPAFLTEINNPYMQLAQKIATKVFGKKSIFIREGGTIGAVTDIQELFPTVPVVLLAMSKITDNYHGINENFKLKQAELGIECVKEYLREIAKI